MRDKLEARQVDIVTLKIDAIVNAANTTLLGGGGRSRSVRNKAMRYQLPGAMCLPPC